MSKTRITADLNTDLLNALEKYAADRGMGRDFVLSVAVDQFLNDPDNYPRSTT